MKIVHVIARLNIGGPALHVGLACEGLRRRGHETWLVAGRVVPPEGDMAYACTQRAVEPAYVEALGRSLDPISDARALAALVALFRRVRPQVVHTHTSKAGAVGRLAAVLARVPAIVHTFHGNVLTGYFGRAASLGVRAFERAMAAVTDRVVVLTQGQRSELTRLGIARSEQIDVVPFGLELAGYTRAAELRKTAREALSLREEDHAVGIVGRLTAIKGHRHFLEMARRLAREDPRAAFVLAGDGELRAELEESIERLGLSARTRMLGWQKEMAQVYAALDVLALTSLNEGSPVVLKEAMAAGLPCVAHAVGGVPDLIADGVNGFLVPVGDPEALTRAVVRALSRGPERDALVERARSRVLAEHGAEAMVLRLEAVYERALGG